MICSDVVKYYEILQHCGPYKLRCATPIYDIYGLKNVSPSLES